MAEFFGHMNEMRSKSVQIQDMEAAVFKAMLHFIYTDMVPELDEEPAVAAMAQRLLAAADRYARFYFPGLVIPNFVLDCKSARLQHRVRNLTPSKF